jgi:hypothetical protein
LAIAVYDVLSIDRLSSKMIKTLMKRPARALFLLLVVAAASWLAAIVPSLGDEEAHFATLQSLEYSHRGTLKSQDLPTILTPSEGLGVGQAFLVLEDPLRAGSAIWVALDRLQDDGHLLAVPGSALTGVHCADLRRLDVDRWAATQVADQLDSSCVD